MKNSELLTKRFDKNIAGLRKITDSVKDDKQRSYHGVNFFQSDDLRFILAILRGEYQIAGFTNRALQPHLAGWNSQKIGRVLKRFRLSEVS